MCECLFWRFDKRAFVHGARHTAYCPLCALFEFDHGDVWVLHNDCQGVFSEPVFHSRAEAEAECGKPEWRDADCVVVPAKVLAEPEWRHWQRRMDERERGY